MGVTVHSYESVSYMKGMGCNGLGKNTIFNEHSVVKSKIHAPIRIFIKETVDHLFITLSSVNVTFQVDNSAFASKNLLLLANCPLPAFYYCDKYFVILQCQRFKDFKQIFGYSYS